MSTKKLESVMKAVPGLQAAARADDQGNVLEAAGALDAEITCAVVALCSRHVRELADLLGGGEVQRWSLVTQKTTLCVTPVRGGFVAATGAAAKNPDALSRALTQAVADAKVP
jgi:predicted regulator of Ras-like GTPase activity (Roadblock/LC7/MglB family)